MRVSKLFDFTSDTTTQALGGIDVFLADAGGTTTVDGGTVTMNDRVLPKTTSGNSVRYGGAFDPIREGFEAPYAVFTISGSDAFPHLVDSIPLPTDRLTMIFPGGPDTLLWQSDSIPDHGAVTVVWEPTGADSVRITVSQDRDFLGRYSFVQRMVPDLGSMTIAANMNNFIPGPLKVEFVRGFKKTGHIADGREYTMTTSTIIRRKIMLVEE
jgi:hypothetical protein